MPIARSSDTKMTPPPTLTLGSEPLRASKGPSLKSHKALTIMELKRLWRKGLASGPGRYGSMDEIKAEARRRLGQ